MRVFIIFSKIIISTNIPFNEIMLWFSGYYKIQDDKDKQMGEAFGAVEGTKPCVAPFSVRELDRDRSFVLSFPEVLVFFFTFWCFSELSIVTCPMMMQRRAVSKLIMFGASKHTFHVFLSKRQTFPIGNRFWCISSSGTHLPRCVFFFGSILNQAN